MHWRTHGIQIVSMDAKVSARTRDARWFVFRPKIPLWVNLGASCNGKCWCILCPFGLFYGNSKYLWLFGIFCGHLVHTFPPVLVSCTKKNLATLAQTHGRNGFA
jgi:hypothetical protein